MSERTPPEVRILPMSPEKEDEFQDKTIPEIQDEFFRQSLAVYGKYQYQKKGIASVDGAVFLFQFANRILAQARFKEQVPYGKVIDEKYHGTLNFYPKSVNIFPEALTLAQLQEFWPKLLRLSYTKHFLDPKYLPAFERRFVQNPYSRNAADNELGPTPKEQYVTSRYIRDTKKSLNVKSLHCFRCQVVGCPFPSTLPDGNPYAEGHHLKPLGHGGPDDETNILCLCPYHHVAFDMGATDIKAGRLRKVDGHTVSEKSIDYHNDKIYGSK